MIAHPPADAYHSAANLAQALADLIKNPKVITEITAEKLKASQLSEEQRKEVEAAHSTLDENKRILAQLVQTRTEHEQHVKDAQAGLDKNAEEIERKRQELINTRNLFKADVLAKSEEILRREQEAQDRHEKLDVRTADIIQREQTCHEIMSSISKREKSVETREQKLADAQALLAAKKKKLADAAKED